MRRFRPGTFELVALALLAATAADAISTSRGWHGPDLARFAAAGGTMLSGGWAHTFHNPWVQAGPLELLTASVLHRIAGSSPAALAIAVEGTVCLALIATFRAVVGRRALPLAFVVGGALVLGPLPDVYTTGHVAEPVAGILWLLAARRARAGRVATAGLLVGLSAGFELWGVLGVTVLALAPCVRRSLLGAAVAGATAALLLAPFALAGDFHMFAFQWFVAGGPIHVLVGVGHPFGWPLRLLQSGATVGLGGGLALLIRRSPASIFVVPAATTAVRLLLDPLGLFYYWDPVILLALLAAATAFVRRDALRAWVRSAAAPAAPGLRGLGLAPAAEHEAAEGEAEAKGADGEPADGERLPPRRQALPTAEGFFLLGGQLLAAALLAESAPRPQAQVHVVEDLRGLVAHT